MSSAKRSSRRMAGGMAGRMARIVSATFGAGRRTATVVYQHRYYQGFHDSFAAVLTDIGFLLLTALGITGSTCRLRIRQQRGESSAFRASRELVVTFSMFPHHIFVSIGATVRCELQSL